MCLQGNAEKDVHELEKAKRALEAERVERVATVTTFCAREF